MFVKTPLEFGVRVVIAFVVRVFVETVFSESGLRGIQSPFIFCRLRKFSIPVLLLKVGFQHKLIGAH